ncbi:hypothetical protein K450DRAFT_245885 [Umbelopsis ramanniana AG]|uniref:Uncharacterized protein n=1 Tax=Umbelopsis ramanniana AG TaxID=1314678 RepID=A0AAD5E833_UMBRA|nr:uncharacterized protein K450DRAFT_245885 [Umbelopsis ramanniana AG]KAI8578647.1 hypothetical protein K450DRAFT_245885 [Umbelopsis ramanniana AG]
MGLLINRPRPTTEQATTAMDGETGGVNESARSSVAEPEGNHLRLFNGRRSGHPHLNLNIDHSAGALLASTDPGTMTHPGMTRSRSIGLLQSDRESRIRTLYLEKEHLLHRLSLTNAELEQLLGAAAMPSSVMMERAGGYDTSRIDYPNPALATRYVQVPPHRRSPLWTEHEELQTTAQSTFQSIVHTRHSASTTPLTLSEVSASVLNAASRSPIMPPI